MIEIINGLEVEVDAQIPTVHLVTRYVDCSTLDAETFTKYIVEDILKADKIYSDMREPIIKANYEARIAREEANIIKFAEEKYKRQFYRDRYISSEMKKIKRTSNFTSSLDYFDFQPDKSRMGIPYDCILSVEDVEKLAPKCFELVKDDKYFKNAKGWTIKYQTSFGPINGVEDRSLRSAFRPFVDMILDDELSKELQQSVDALARSVASFYEGCTYFGD
jgi:hypothetical protein